MSLFDILDRGYFPKELPNPFNTTSFARAVTNVGTTLPADFNHNPSGRNKLLGKPTKYSHARGGFLRRQLSLPNPLFHYLLSCELYSNWVALQPSIGGTAISATNPVLSASGRAIQGAHHLDENRELAVQTRLNNKYILKTDIDRFYPSVYTHTIPWALHSKASAKTNRSMALFGNRLDYLIRNGQDGQTNGIPIGPDTSLVIAEILMQKCDRDLLSEFSSMRGHRFIDDYELGFRTRNDAEDALHFLDDILANYELALNPKKTEILELPCSFEALWVSSLRSFEFRDSAPGQQSDLFRFFDLAFEFHNQYPDENVLKFAVGRLRSLTVNPSNWEIFQNLLLNCATPEPETLPFVLEAIINRVNAGATPSLAKIEEVMNSIIIEHAKRGHSSEVAWALWACLALNIKVLQTAVDEVSKCNDSIIALLALHCERQSLVDTPLDYRIWSSCMDQKNLYDEHWLLSYEANVKGWLPSIGGTDHVSRDPNFQFLKAAGVSFYDVTRAVPATPAGPSPMPNLPKPTSISSTVDY